MYIRTLCLFRYMYFQFMFLPFFYLCHSLLKYISRVLLQFLIYSTNNINVNIILKVMFLSCTILNIQSQYLFTPPQHLTRLCRFHLLNCYLSCTPYISISRYFVQRKTNIHSLKSLKRLLYFSQNWQKRVIIYLTRSFKITEYERFIKNRRIHSKTFVSECT